MTKTKILIIEDTEELLVGYRDMFAKAGIDLLVATTLLGAVAAFEAHEEEIAAVFIDGLFPHAEGMSPVPERGMKCSGVKFLANVGRSCPMFACSSERSVNQQLLAAGAIEMCEKGSAILRRAQEILRES